jgi:hypothetical protein
LGTVSDHVVVNTERFRQAVHGVERENFRPGDALTALERATVHTEASGERWAAFSDEELAALRDIVAIYDRAPKPSHLFPAGATKVHDHLMYEIRGVDDDRKSRSQ